MKRLARIKLGKVALVFLIVLPLCGSSCGPVDADQEVGKSTVGMLFISLPQLFYTEVPFGAFLGPLFYVLVALAAICRPTTGFFTVALLVYLLWIPERRVVRWAAGVCLMGIALATFGGAGWLPSYYNPAKLFKTGDPLPAAFPP